MSQAYPTSDQERRLAAAARAGVRLHAPPWNRSKTASWATFFILTLLAVVALGGLLALVFGDIASTLTLSFLALVCCTLGELLIRRMKLFGSGPEEALWLAGTLLAAFVVIDRAIYGFDVSGVCVILAVAVAIAALRLLNPFFATAALLLIVPPLFQAAGRWTAAGFCVAAAVASLVASLFEIRRPSVQATLDLMMFVMSGAAFVCLEISNLLGDRWQRFKIEVALSFLLLGLVFFAVGVKRRLHAPLVTAMLCLGFVAWECRNLTGLSPETRLIIWGSLLLVLSVIAERRLRGRPTGITSDALDTAASASILDLAGAVAASVQVHQPSPAAPQPLGGGGQFGGGGASGDY